MEGEAPYRRGGMKSRRSRSFYGLLGGYSVLSQGCRSRLGEDSVEEEEPEGTEVMAALSGASEASETPNLAFSNPPLVS
ncbi:hypothetical protein O181_126929 [Austropuccinia psidii MF-1]|uniref:Uncharacterized protein n=1 Tax=Austropuccinia psidii MF-1 TaxID=1389203 RepID=A0A9Q3KX00_9BASI|nr:hypothetical protein [Austropuccinia psidii MF-1]